MKNLLPALLAGFCVLTVSGGSVRAASYVQTDGTVVDPILNNFSSVHPYSGINLGPGVSAPHASLHIANLIRANLSGATSQVPICTELICASQI
jgi:hypothetical protein